MNAWLRERVLFDRLGLCFLILLLAACSAETSIEPPLLQPTPPPNQALHLFGFVGVACGEDYSDEVADFTNVATTCAPDPSVGELVANQLDTFEQRGLRALLNVEGLFFVEAPTAPLAPYGGPRLVLRDDYRHRWEELVKRAGLAERRHALAAVFVADEPTWRGISPEDLSTAYAAVRSTFPDLSLLLVEAYPVLDQLVIPPAVDWVAFDRYGVLDPANDAEYLADLALLKAQRSRPDQQIILIMETQWLLTYAEFGIPPKAMAGVAESYYRLANRDAAVIGLVGYLWPGGLNARGQLGARDLPESVRAAYRRIGEEIIQRTP